MDSPAARKEASDDITREYLIGISNSLPDKILGQKCGPEETDNSTGSTKNVDKAEEQMSELISISYDQSPDGQAVPIAPRRP
uniref:Uncharacterized protein n=1 Tax=Kalanchoe fedtschenkoi TaxID=63787 RepID=A0A7N0UYB4_KALFE